MSTVTRKNADQARELTRKHLKGPVIQPWLDYLDAVITNAATEGRFSITNPWMERRSDVGRSAPEYPTPEMQEAIKRELVASGFAWLDHPDPDPGDTRGGPYTEISWKG